MNARPTVHVRVYRDLVPKLKEFARRNRLSVSTATDVALNHFLALDKATQRAAIENEEQTAGKPRRRRART